MLDDLSDTPKRKSRKMKTYSEDDEDYHTSTTLLQDDEDISQVEDTLT
jgi:hypothetical protein